MGDAEEGREMPRFALALYVYDVCEPPGCHEAQRILTVMLLISPTSQNMGCQPSLKCRRCYNEVAQDWIAIDLQSHGRGERERERGEIR